MMRYNPYAYTVNHVNLSLSKRNGRNSLLFTRKTYSLMVALRSTGCVDKFAVTSKLNKTTGRIDKLIRFSVLLYKGTPFFKGVRLVSSPSRRHTISLTALRVAAVPLGASTLILSTSRGLISHREALRLGTGGLILCIVS